MSGPRGGEPVSRLLNDIDQRLLVERQIRHEPLQPGVLSAKLPHLPQLDQTHPQPRGLRIHMQNSRFDLVQTGPMATDPPRHPGLPAGTRLKLVENL